jgi:RHS repeat-associated protein
VADDGGRRTRAKDGTGLEYLRARYYAPTVGRFTTRDVWGGDPNAPMSYNAWLYAYADPVKLTDPTGKSAIDLASLAATCNTSVSGPCEFLWSNAPDIARLLGCPETTPTPQPPLPTPTPTIPPPAVSYVQRGRVALQQVTQQCQQVSPTCYDSGHWWMVDWLSQLSPDRAATMEEQALEAYRTQRVDLDAVVSQNRKNPLNINASKLPAHEYYEVIFVMSAFTRRSPVMSQFLDDLHLPGRYNEANFEPIFLLAHIAGAAETLYQSTKACYYDQVGCWTIPFPGEK